MSEYPTWFYVALFFILLITVRGLIVLCHELGHALAIHKVYKGKQSLYIGSYGDPTAAWLFKSKQFNFYIKYNPLDWDHGLCVAEEQLDLTFRQHRNFILGGPLGSLALSLFFASFIFTCSNLAFKVYASLAAFYAFADFINNLIPKSRPIKLYNGGITYNDGYQLKKLLKEKEHYGAAEKMIELYNNKEYKEGLRYFENLLRPVKSSLALQVAAHLYLYEKNYETAIQTFKELQNHCPLTADDYCNLGLAHANLGEYKPAQEHYDAALSLVPNHVHTLNNRGYNYNLMKDYEKALHDFNSVVQLQPDHAYAFNNMGFAKIKLGNEEEGLKDIEKSMELDSTNAYAYRNKGIYYQHKKQYNEALKWLEKAKHMDAFVHDIDRYINETHTMLNGTLAHGTEGTSNSVT